MRRALLEACALIRPFRRGTEAPQFPPLSYGWAGRGLDPRNDSWSPPELERDQGSQASGPLSRGRLGSCVSQIRGSHVGERKNKTEQTRTASRGNSVHKRSYPNGQ